MAGFRKLGGLRSPSYKGHTIVESILGSMFMETTILLKGCYSGSPSQNGRIQDSNFGFRSMASSHKSWAYSEAPQHSKMLSLLALGHCPHPVTVYNICILRNCIQVILLLPSGSNSNPCPLNPKSWASTPAMHKHCQLRTLNPKPYTTLKPPSPSPR